MYTSTPRTSNTPPESLGDFPGPRAHRRGAGSGPERRLKSAAILGFLPGDVAEGSRRIVSPLCYKVQCNASGIGMMLYNYIIYTRNILSFIVSVHICVFYCSRATSIGWEWERLRRPDVKNIYQHLQPGTAVELAQELHGFLQNHLRLRLFSGFRLELCVLLWPKPFPKHIHRLVYGKSPKRCPSWKPGDGKTSSIASWNPLSIFLGGSI